MALYGYSRVSSLDHDLAIQEEKLRTAGCQVIRAEKRSGTRRTGRTELQLLLDFLHNGDTLVITRIDRGLPPWKWSSLAWAIASPHGLPAFASHLGSRRILTVVLSILNLTSGDIADELGELDRVVRALLACRGHADF